MALGCPLGVLELVGRSACGFSGCARRLGLSTALPGWDPAPSPTHTWDPARPPSSPLTSASRFHLRPLPCWAPSAGAAAAKSGSNAARHRRPLTRRALPVLGRARRDLGVSRQASELSRADSGPVLPAKGSLLPGGVGDASQRHSRETWAVAHANRGRGACRALRWL